MALIEFFPRKPLLPLFAIKLPSALCKINSILEPNKYELIIKKSLEINEKRLIKFKEVEDSRGELGLIMIVYDYIYNKKKPEVLIPQNERGFFDFNIYELDFNRNVNVESIIENQKETNKR